MLRTRLYCNELKACAKFVYEECRDTYENSLVDRTNEWPIQELEQVGRAVVAYLHEFSVERTRIHSGLVCEVMNGSGGSFPLYVSLICRRSNLGRKIRITFSLLEFTDWTLLADIRMSDDTFVRELPRYKLHRKTKGAERQQTLMSWFEEFSAMLEEFTPEIDKELSSIE